MAKNEYRYLLHDLRTNEPVAELPLRGVQWSRKLSGVGQASASLRVVPAMRIDDVMYATTPGKMGLYMLRDEQPMWGGVVWKRTRNSADSTMALQCKTFESYFDRVFNKKTRYWSSYEQLSIAREVIDEAARQVLVTVDQSLSTRSRERTMFYYEFKSVGEELSQLAALEDGFDYNVQIRIGSDGSIERHLDFGYPQLGVPRDQTGFIFEYPGNIVNYSVDEDAEQGGNVVYAIGAGEGTEQLTAEAVVAQDLQEGWPRLELSRSYKSVVRLSTLGDHAQSDLARLKSPVTVFSMTVLADGDPALGSYTVGDWARFKIQDNWFPEMLDSKFRITGMTVSVGDAGEKEKVALELGGSEAEAA